MAALAAMVPSPANKSKKVVLGNVIGMFDNLGCHSNGYVITIKREVCLNRPVFA